MIDSSTKIFKRIKDRTREGFSSDTKAQIFYSEGKFKEALKTIEKAINVLRLGENATYLAETYRTKIKILISMDDITAATFCLMEAVEIAKARISEDAANNLVKDYEICLREHLERSEKALSEFKAGENILPTTNIETEAISFDALELVLPSSLSMYENIQGVWINNTHLENIGLVKDSLAVVVPVSNVKRGDLIAIEETENKYVSCGFYDNEFGIVCLEGEDSEPLLFDEEKISIIGKIVGVATEYTSDGKLIVEPLPL